MDKKKIIKALVKPLKLLYSVGIMMLSWYLLIQIMTRIWSPSNSWIVTIIVSVVSAVAIYILRRFYFSSTEPDKSTKSTEHIMLNLLFLAIYSIAAGFFFGCIFLFFMFILYVPSNLASIIFPILSLVLIGQFIYSFWNSKLLKKG